MGYDATKIYETKSRFLKAEDLNKAEHKVTIANVVLEEMEDDKTGLSVNKLALMLAGVEKGVLLNKTNSDVLSACYGGDTDMWIGKSICIYPTMVSFGGKSVPAIRMRPVFDTAPAGSLGEPVATQLVNTVETPAPGSIDAATADDPFWNAGAQ